MKLLKSKWFLVFTTVLIAGFLIAQTIKSPTFSGISNFEILEFNNGTLRSNTVLKVRNDNWFSYTGKELHFKMYYKDLFIAEGHSEEPFRFNKRTESMFSLETMFYADSLKNELKKILHHDSIQLSVHVGGKFSFLNIKSSKKIDTWLATKNLVDALVKNSMGDDGLKMESIKIKELTLPSTLLDISFRFTNKLPFAIKLKEIRGDIYADKLLNTKVSAWKFNVDRHIEQNKSEVIEGIADVNNVNSALTGMSKVLKGSLDYYLNGEALVAIEGREISIPLRQHFKVYPLSKEIVILAN